MGLIKAFLLTLLFVLLPVIMGCGTIAHFGGDFKGEPHEMWDAITPATKSLIKKAFEFKTCDQCEIIDYHTHVSGTSHSIKVLCPGIDASGVYFNPRLFT